MLALLSGGATGPVNGEHVDLAVIVELIHIATLVHDDIMDEAERRRAQPTVNARWGNSLSVLLGDCLFAHALNLSTNFDNADISRVDRASGARSLLRRNHSNAAPFRSASRDRGLSANREDEDRLALSRSRELGATINAAEPDDRFAR